MSKHYSTAPEDRISFPHKVAYGVGGFVNNLLASAIGGMMVILNLALGIDPRVVSLLGSLPRLTDAITDPLMGFISDRTSTRWGRRRPYLFIGAIASGVVFALLWQLPAPAQFRLKLVDYGADGVYSGHVAVDDRGVLERASDWVSGIVNPAPVNLNTTPMDDVEHEVVISPPLLVTGAWVSVDLPLTDFPTLVTRDHLAQILISGDLPNVYVDNIYLYRSDSAAAASDSSAPGGGVQEDAGGQEDAEGSMAPAVPAPLPAQPADRVISFYSDAYENVNVDYFSTDWDEAEVEDAEAGGDPVKRYSDLRFAGIDFGERPIDASAMTHVHIDIWTPDPTPEGGSQAYYVWYFLIGSIVFFVGYTIFATPWVALGYELTPDYNERTRLMGVQNFVSNIAFVIAPWFLAIMTNPAWFRNQIHGARWLAIAIGAVTIILGVLPAIFLRERMAPATQGSSSSKSGVMDDIRDFLGGLLTTVKSKPFLLLCLATFLIFNSFIMISSFQIFVFIYHIYGGNQADGAWLAGLAGTVMTVCGFLVIMLVTWLGTKIGKRKALVVSTTVSMVGYGLKWFCYTPESPMMAILPAPLLAFGLGGLFTLMGSMVADVVDVDELSTGQRREGMFGSIYWWVVKLGSSVAIFAGGFLLVATGFDVELGSDQSARTLVMLRAMDAFVPLTASAIAILAILKFPITEESAREVRTELERRRGTGVAATA